MTSDLELGWVAGIFEGEGAIVIIRPSAKNRQRHDRVGVTVSMTDEDIVRRLHSVAGLGRVYGPYQYSGNKKPYWQWHAHNHDARRFLTAIVPHLGVRRAERAREALRCELPSGEYGSEVMARSQREKTLCPKGHPYSDENTYRSNGRRICATCSYARVKARRARAKGGVPS